MLPIQLPQFTPELWRSLEKQLIEIENLEKSKLEPRDRKVNKILATVQHSAKAKRWQEVFNMLRDREIIALEPQKVALQVTLLQLLTAQKMACALAIPKYESPKPDKVNKFRSIDINLKPLNRIVEKHKPRKDHKKSKQKGISTLTKGKILAEVFNKILTDKWQDVKTLHEKFGKVSPIPMERSRFDDRLEYRAKKGEIFKFKPDGSNCAFYSSNPDASSFENEWMDLNRAYAIACSNGYTAAINTFRCKADKADMTKEGILRYYRRFGLEYRFKSEIPEGENRFFKWRVIN